MRLRDYSIDEIFEKNLLILLPYYIINYEKELPKIVKDEQRSQCLVDEYKKIVVRLEKVTWNDDTGLLHDMEGMMRQVVEYLLRKKPVLKERMCEIMGGKVLRLPSDEIREAKEAARAEGRAEGKAEGKLEGKIDGIKGVIVNMLKHGMSEEDICKVTECGMALVEEVRASM